MKVGDHNSIGQEIDLLAENLCKLEGESNIHAPVLVNLDNVQEHGAEDGRWIVGSEYKGNCLHKLETGSLVQNWDFGKRFGHFQESGIGYWNEGCRRFEMRMKDENLVGLWDSNVVVKDDESLEKVGHKNLAGRVSHC